MKKIKYRANAASIIAGSLILGFCLFFVKLADSGQSWAVFHANQDLYSDGVLNTGTITDRNGIILAKAESGVYMYADSEAVRRACLHTVGDFIGNIGTGALSAFADKLAGYSLINGTYSRTGEGNTLRLTIDAELCAAAYNALAGRRGAVIACDYTNGEILCMVSSPGFDPSNPPSDLSGPAYEGAYLNRGLSSSFTPGSIFKIVTLAAAIENIGDLESRTFTCAGSCTVDGETVNCTASHGAQDIKQAFGNSCNVAFAELSLELGADRIIKYAENMGLCSAHDLSGIPTAAGSLSDADAGSAELVWLGIGQYEDLVSPFAMLRLCAAIANGGILIEPTLLSRSFPSVSPISRILRESTADKLAEMMAWNTENAYVSAGFPAYGVGAKTGTAEVGANTPHAWLAGFASDASRPIAFVVLVENGGGGLAAAGPVAKSLLNNLS